MAYSKSFTSGETSMPPSNSLMPLCGLIRRSCNFCLEQGAIMSNILMVCACQSLLLSLAKFSYADILVERFLKAASSLDEDLSGIVTGIKNERDEIERLRGV